MRTKNKVFVVILAVIMMLTMFTSVVNATSSPMDPVIDDADYAAVNRDKMTVKVSYTDTSSNAKVEYTKGLKEAIAFSQDTSKVKDAAVTFKLLTNCEVDAGLEIKTVSSTANVTLNLNRFTLTVKNGTSSNNGLVVPSATANLKIEKGTITSDASTDVVCLIENSASTKLTLENVTVDGTRGSIKTAVVYAKEPIDVTATDITSTLHEVSAIKANTTKVAIKTDSGKKVTLGGTDKQFVQDITVVGKLDGAGAKDIVINAGTYTDATIVTKANVELAGGLFKVDPIASELGTAASGYTAWSHGTQYVVSASLNTKNTTTPTHINALKTAYVAAVKENMDNASAERKAQVKALKDRAAELIDRYDNSDENDLPYAYDAEIQALTTDLGSVKAVVDMAALDISIDGDVYYLGGLKVEPTLVVKYNTETSSKTLKVDNTDVAEGDTECKITKWENNVNAGTAKVTLEGVTAKGFEGTRVFEFQIKPVDITSALLNSSELTGTAATAYAKNHVKIVVSGTGATLESKEAYTGANTTKTLTVTHEGTDVGATTANTSVTMAEKTDYKVTYSNNNAAGKTATIVIQGLGNYTGTIQKNFEIDKASLTSATITVPDQVYTGKEIEPAMIKIGDVELVKDVDYIVSNLKDNTSVSNPSATTPVVASMTVTGIGNNYKDSKTNVTFNIIKKDINDLVINVKNPVYTGVQVKPEVVIKNGAVTLEEDPTGSTKDYTVAVDLTGGRAAIDVVEKDTNNNVLVQKITITGKNNYKGTVEKTFTILPKDLSDKTTDEVSVADASGNVSGESKIAYKSVADNKAALTVKYTPTGGTAKTLTGTDYTIAYSNNENAGTARAVITGKGNYSGSVEFVYTIEPKDISTLTPTTAEISAKVFTGAAIQPKVVMEDSGLLVAGVDYVVKYKNNVNVGTNTAEYVIEGKGNYTGTKYATAPTSTTVGVPYKFTINQASLKENDAVTIEIPDQVYTGSGLRPDVIVKLNGNKLSEEDYTVAYANNTAVGEAKVTITGTRNCKDSTTATFNIVKAKDIANAVVKLSKTSYEYIGSKIEPDVTVVYDGKTLEEGKDYSVIYVGNTAVGTATVIVTGQGVYTGKTSATFEIKNASVPSNPSNPSTKPTDSSVSFSDVSAKEWYSTAVNYVVSNKIMTGNPDGTFTPDQKLTRAMAASILYKMAGQPAVSGTSKFSDVKSSDWFNTAVIWASNKGVVSGRADGTFAPNANITREDLAVMIWKYAKSTGKDVSASKDLSVFTDANKVDSYATTQMKWAVGAGVMNGNADKTLKPQGTATRAEAAAMFQNYFSKFGK